MSTDREKIGGPCKVCGLPQIMHVQPCKIPAQAQSNEVHAVPFGIIDPDYARAYSIIRCTAWSYGYAVGMHGSFTRDLDLILVPWSEQCCLPFEHLMRLLAERTGLKVQGEKPTEKPHGRLAWSLLFPAFGDPRWIDISMTPRPAASIAASQENGE